MKAQDVDFKPSLDGLLGPVLDDIEISIVNVEMTPVEIEYGTPIHGVAPFEWTEHMPGPSQFFEWTNINVTSVVDGEIPVAVSAKVPPGS